MPATGNRSCATGALRVVGTEGDVWSSSSYGGDAWPYRAGFVNFDAANVNPLNNTNRSYALSVRCVQHLRDVYDRRSLRKQHLRPGMAEATVSASEVR